MKSKLIPIIAISVALMMLTPVGQASTILKMSSQFTEDSARGQFQKNWANEINKQTNGEVTIEIHWVGELGGATEVAEQFLSGEIQLAALIPGYLMHDFPFHTLTNEALMSISDVAQVAELMERLLVEVPELDKEAERNGVKALFFTFGNPYKLVCREQITKVADMNGKVVHISNRMMSSVFQSVQADTNPLPSDAVYWALSEGLLDCVPIPVNVMARFKIDEVAKHFHDITIWQRTATSVWISVEVWKALTDEQRSIIQELSFVAGRLDLDQLIATSELAIEELKAQGVQFHDFPAEELEKWRKANPDYLGKFVNRMTKLGRGEAARKTVEIWKEVVAH